MKTSRVAVPPGLEAPHFLAALQHESNRQKVQGESSNFLGQTVKKMAAVYTRSAIGW
jgi:hypothetical protein